MLFWLGVQRGYGASAWDGFTTADLEKHVLIYEIGRQIKEILDELMLAETPALAREAVAFALTENANKFANLMPAPRSRQPAYPVSIGAIRDEYRRDALRAGFRNDVVEEKRAAGKIEERWKGPIVSFSANLTPNEEAEIERRVEQAMSSSGSPATKVTLVDSVRMWRRVSRSLEELEAHGFTHVDEPFRFAEPPTRGHDIDAARLAEFRQYCQELLEIVLASYISMVETNFPTLAAHFDRYAALPCAIVLTMPTKDRYGRIYFSKGASRNEVQVHLDDEVVDREYEIETPHGRRAWFRAEMVSEASLVYGPQSSRSGKWMPPGVVRRWVYSWLNDEIDGALLALLASYNISREAADSAGLYLRPF